MTAAGEEYRRRADAFERLIAGTPPDRWDSPSPCADWTASGVVEHVVSFTGYMLGEHARIGDAPAFADFASPLDAFRATRRVMERVLDDPDAPNDTVVQLQWGPGFDLPVHCWDLAMATGQDATMAPEDVDAYWGTGDPDGFEQAFGWQRDKGWYAQAVSVPDDAPIQDRLLGRLGRDPHWTAS
ncbi:MAG: hypothetical protein V7636_1294 [Actinomycetota bacterium]|jgi:uncharacterized protein (TIGR03086 family)